VVTGRQIGRLHFRRHHLESDLDCRCAQLIGHLVALQMRQRERGAAEVERKRSSRGEEPERELRRAPKGRRTELQARLAGLCDAEGALGRAEMKASLRLAGTTPASLQGAAAALHYVRERYEVGHYLMYEEDGYRLLLLSTERSICAAAGLAIA